MEIILWIIFGLLVAGLAWLVKKPDVKHRTLLGIIVIILGVLGFGAGNWMIVETIKSEVEANNFFYVLLLMPIIFAGLASWAAYLILPKLDAEQIAITRDENNKQPKLFAVIYIILASLIFSIMTVFLFVVKDHALKGNLLVVQGLLLLIWVVFTSFYWVQIWGGFKHYNSNQTKLYRAGAIIMFVVICLGAMVNNFARDTALRGSALGGNILIVEGLFILIALALCTYDWVYRWRRMRRKGINSLT